MPQKRYGVKHQGGRGPVSAWVCMWYCQVSLSRPDSQGWVRGRLTSPRQSADGARETAWPRRCWFILRQPWQVQVEGTRWAWKGWLEQRSPCLRMIVAIQHFRVTFRNTPNQNARMHTHKLQCCSSEQHASLVTICRQTCNNPAPCFRTHTFCLFNKLTIHLY